MELEKIFNELKHEPEFGMEYATEVSKFVAQGACRDFRRADENWRNPTLNAERPTFQKKNLGTGAFLAASGLDRVKYDDHRRIRLPYLGSVKLQRELPEGIPYEVRIKQENGRWYASVNYWKPPVGAEEKTHLCGAVDVGITPLAVDSELVHYENPKALYRMLAKLQRWQRTLARRTLARRTVGSRGWHEAQGRINAIHRRINGLRDNAHHQVSRQLVRKYAVLAIESLNVAGMDNCPIRPRPSVMRPAAACCRRSVTRQLVRNYHRGSGPVLSVEQTLLRLRRSPCEFGAGTALDLPTVRPATRSQRKCRAQSANTGNQRSSRAG